jgi:hypothetical protein
MPSVFTPVACDEGYVEAEFSLDLQTDAAGYPIQGVICVPDSQWIVGAVERELKSRGTEANTLLLILIFSAQLVLIAMQLRLRKRRLSLRMER